MRVLAAGAATVAEWSAGLAEAAATVAEWSAGLAEAAATVAEWSAGFAEAAATVAEWSAMVAGLYARVAVGFGKFREGFCPGRMGAACRGVRLRPVLLPFSIRWLNLAAIHQINYLGGRLYGTRLLSCIDGGKGDVAREF